MSCAVLSNWIQLHVKYNHMIIFLYFTVNYSFVHMFVWFDSLKNLFIIYIINKGHFSPLTVSYSNKLIMHVCNIIVQYLFIVSLSNKLKPFCITCLIQ